MSEISGYQIDLSDGRHVWAAEREDDFLVEFKNAEGQITRLRLSREAADALYYLLARMPKTEAVVMKFMAHIVARADKLNPEIHWTEVKQDTAPEPA